MPLFLMKQFMRVNLERDVVLVYRGSICRARGHNRALNHEMHLNSITHSHERVNTQDKRCYADCVMSVMDKKLSLVFKALGNERRLRIVRILFNSPDRGLSVGELAYKIGLSIKSTSKHVLLLERAEILKGKRRGPSVIYSISINDKQLCRYLRNKLIPK